MIRFLLNILWLVLGGWTTALSWFFASFLMALSLVGIPWARAAFNIGVLNLWPFGSSVVPRQQLTGSQDLGTGVLGLIGNIIWIIFAGWWLTLIHLFYALLLMITILGIPFALQHLKLARICLMPVGKSILLNY